MKSFQFQDSPKMEKKFSKYVKKLLEKNQNEPLNRKTAFLTEIMQKNYSSFLNQNAYVLTNLGMMVWSIIYHSWFGLILLLWANVIWIRPDQRGRMMKSSPFLVAYAICLLIINYIFGTIFLDDERPTHIFGQPCSQIGLVKDSAIYLIMKSALLTSFWFTVRLSLMYKPYKQVILTNSFHYRCY